MPFLPRDFEVPVPLEMPRFRLRGITIHDVVKDYDAIMKNQEYLWRRYGEAWGWPPKSLSLEQDLIDLAWHQKEGQLRRSFDFAVMTPSEDRLLGCVYLDPSEKQGYDAEACYWLRQDDVPTDLESELDRVVREWLRDDWPFERVGFPGHDLSWTEWEALP